jgi:hypothetical protein
VSLEIVNESLQIYSIQQAPLSFLACVVLGRRLPDGEEWQPTKIIEILRQVHAEVQDTVRSGWNMIDPYVPTAMPYFQTDPASGLGDNDFLEFSALKAEQSLLFADMWRVSRDGKVTLIRDYWEDALPLQNGPSLGTWISPNWMMRSLAEIVRHARAMTERFESPTTVSFRCEWHGLRGRTLHSPNTQWWMRKCESRSDHRGSSGSYPVTMLTNSWPEIVADLIGPLMRGFSTEQVISPDSVRGQVPTWLHGS